MAKEGFLPEINDKRSIISGDGGWQDMDCDIIWRNYHRWNTGDGPQELDHGTQMTITLLHCMKIFRLCMVIQV